ncbi:MAG: hypothetical protein ACLPSH_01115 [Vulcanimicrobiaceae bacterium]
MHFWIASSLARSRQQEILREAELLRSLRRDRPRRVGALRRCASRAVRALGRACLSLGDALGDLSETVR